MNVILFFTYDVSLKDWFDKGLLDRELKIYENISKNYNIKFTFVTYGTSEDLKYISKDSDFKVLPIYEYFRFYLTSWTREKLNKYSRARY